MISDKRESLEDNGEEDFFSTESFCLCWIPTLLYWTAGLGEEGFKIQETVWGKLKLGPCGKDSNVQYMAHLLNQVSYNRTINSEYNSEFEDTDETDHHFAPKQSHQQPSRGGNGCQKW